MARSPDRILDELLVLRCQGGDADAFEGLVRRWHGPLRRHAWHLTGDQEATRDIVQEAWLDIIRGVSRLREPASFRGWAYRIVGNKAADWVRRTQRLRELHEEAARQRPGVSGQEPSDEQNAQIRVRRGIKLLPAIGQQILSMKYIDRLSTWEIAHALDIPQGTVKSRLHHAREQLRKILQGDDQ